MIDETGGTGELFTFAGRKSERTKKRAAHFKISFIFEYQMKKIEKMREKNKTIFLKE